MQGYKIAIIGLGYVGLPLAVAFSGQYETIGFDINDKRVDELKANFDRTHELTAKELCAAKNLSFTSSQASIVDCDIYIITVPTPILSDQTPDLKPLKSACELIGKVLTDGNIVVFESTVFPGATEDVCVPILEQSSGMVYNSDFFCGYSPERINPGDKSRTLADIVKVTSGSTPEVAQTLNTLYASIIPAGTYPVSSIKIAEAAKIIENIQRDVNIALVNELSIIFNKLEIDTNEVLDAACTKWNFLNFRPGIVGGHCIGVDPYYLTYKARLLGCNPKIITAGREINDDMGRYIARRVIKEIIKLKNESNKFRVLILGFTFKENCPDIRNTKVIDIIRELLDFNVQVCCFDPIADIDEAQEQYGINLVTDAPSFSDYSAVIYAVAHDDFRKFVTSQLPSIYGTDTFIYDVKNELLLGENVIKL